jgi:hypothetical protein
MKGMRTDPSRPWQSLPAPKDAVVAEISDNLIYKKVGNGIHIVF